MLNLLYQAVEVGALSLNSGLEPCQVILSLAFEALRQRVVLRKVQVDDAKLAHRIGLASAGRGLHQSGRESASFRQQEQADLCHVCAGGDVDVIVLALGIECVFRRQIVKRCEDLLEVPRIALRTPCESHLRGR